MEIGDNESKIMERDKLMSQTRIIRNNVGLGDEKLKIYSTSDKHIVEYSQCRTKHFKMFYDKNWNPLYLIWSFEGVVSRWDDSISHVNFRELEMFVVDYIGLIERTACFLNMCEK